MGFSVKLSAPGKVILFGEYSVVFNKPAIAATLCLRTKLHLQETNLESIQLIFTALGLSKTFQLKDIKEHFKIDKTESWETYLNSLTKAFECLYEKTYGTGNLIDAQKFALIAFFHCFRDVFDSCGGFQLRIESELPVGSGVGSSASFSVVLSAAVLLYQQYHMNQGKIGLTERDENDKLIIPDKLKKEISDVAFSCEKIFHGSPSGVDHNTILQGSMLEFIKSDSGNKMNHILTTPIKILLVNTNVPRSTKKLVGSVKQLRENHPTIIDSVLRGMEEVAKSAVVDLINFKDNDDVRKVEAHLGELISLNHNLLRVLGVSHATLEFIFETAKKYNLNAKLTGAGGGGFGFIYVPRNVELSVVKTVEKELSNAGFTVFDVALGGPGLQVDELIL